MTNISRNSPKTLSSQLNAKTRKKKKALICNFRAPTQKEFLRWKKFERLIKEDLHSDVCYVVLQTLDAFLKSFEDPEVQTRIKTANAIINLSQQNTFHYIVKKARRNAPIEGIDLCQVRNCQEVAINKIYLKKLSKNYLMCKKHTNEYKKQAAEITPLSTPDNLLIE